MEKQALVPRLVFPGDSRLNREETIVCSASEPHRGIHVRIPALADNRVFNSCYGWLLLSSLEETRFSLWNPDTQKTIHLPLVMPKPAQDINAAVLWNPPNDPDSKVLLFDRARQVIKYCLLRQRRWIEISYKEICERIVDREGDEAELYYPVVSNGKLYAVLLCQRWEIVEISIVGAKSNHLEIRSLECGKPNFEYINETKIMVESCGDLVMVQIGYAGANLADAADMEVHKLDLNAPKKEWKRLGSDDRDRAFFLTYECINSFSCNAKGQEFQGGRVYYLSRNDPRLRSIDIEDGSQVLAPPCRDRPKTWVPHFWVLSTSSLVSISQNDRKISRKPKAENKQSSGKNEDASKSLKDRDESRVMTISLLDLPGDIVRQIADKLVLVDYTNFRATSKTLSLLAPLVRWREETFRVKQRDGSLVPWLMFSRKDGSTHHFLELNAGDHEFLVTAPPPLVDAKIMCSKDGWVLMSERLDRALFFYNPFTKTTITLPEERRCQSFCFTCAPTSPECIVVGHGSLSLDILSMRDQQWHEFDIPEAYRHTFSDAFYRAPIFCDGAFYFLGEHGRLAVFRYEDGNAIEFRILDGIQGPCVGFYDYFLAEWNGKLVYVFVGSEGTWVRVFALDTVMLSWKEVKNLGKYSLFIHRSGSFSETMNIPEMENKIHFARVYGEASVLSYSLEKNQYEYIGNQRFEMANYYQTREYLSSCWIQPNWV